MRPRPVGLLARHLLHSARSLQPEILLSALAVLAGIFLRLSHLGDRPFGLDMDEANILYWAGESLRTGKWSAYAPEFTRWEMLPGYWYYAVEALFPAYPRLGPTILSILEIAATGWLAGSLLGRRAGWAAAALLSLCPWHLYYSRIVGTCVGVGLLAVVARQARERLGGAAVQTAGLLYYATFRLVALRVLLESLFQRRARAVLLSSVGLVTAMGIVLALEGTIEPFLSRGAYNFQGVRLDALNNLLHALKAPFLPVPAAFAQTTDEFMADYVHTGLARSLGGSPPLGWALAALSAAGLLLLARLPKERKRRLGAEGLFLVGCWLLLGWMGPSLSRLLIVLPFLALFAALAVEGCRERWGRGAGVVVLAASLAGSSWSSADLVRRLGDEAALEAIFHHRFRKLAAFVEREIPHGTPRTVILMTDHGHPSARYWAARSGKFSVLPPLSPDDLERIMNYNKRWGSQYLLTDAVPEEAERLSGSDKRSRTAAAVARIEARSQIVQRREIWDGGQLLGHLLQVEWPYDLFGSASSAGFFAVRETSSLSAPSGAAAYSIFSTKASCSL